MKKTDRRIHAINVVVSIGNFSDHLFNHFDQPTGYESCISLSSKNLAAGHVIKISFLWLFSQNVYGNKRNAYCNTSRRRLFQQPYIASPV